MSAEEEVSEHVQHAHDPFDKRVAATMAVIAALLAIVSVLGQHFNTEKLLNQQLSSDQWAFYQAKDIRRYTAQLGSELLKDVHAPAAALKTYADDSLRYKGQTEVILDRAKEYERERDKTGRVADFFHFSEVFLECAIVFSSLSILSKRKPLFFAGLLAGAVGICIAAVGGFDEAVMFFSGPSVHP